MFTVHKSKKQDVHRAVYMYTCICHCDIVYSRGVYRVILQVIGIR